MLSSQFLCLVHKKRKGNEMARKSMRIEAVFVSVSAVAWACFDFFFFSLYESAIPTAGLSTDALIIGVDSGSVSPLTAFTASLAGRTFAVSLTA